MTTQAPPAPVVGQPPEPPPEMTNQPPPPHEPPPVAPRAPARARRRWRFGIQSKLLIMLLVTSIASALVVGVVGYQSGKNALQNAAFNQLTQVRSSRTREVTSFFDQLKNSLVIYTRGATALKTYYQDVFIKGLDGNSGNTTDPAGFDLGTNIETGPYRDFNLADAYKSALASNAVDLQGTVLLQDTRTSAVENALRGQTGTVIEPDYLGQESLVAYAPLDIEGLRWVIVAKIDTAEAFQPVTDFTRNMILATAAMIFLVCLASMILAQTFVRPVRRPSPEYGRSRPVI